MSADFHRELGLIIGASRVLVAADDVAPFCTDWRGRYSGNALCVALPGSTEEVAAVVRACVAAGVAVVPQGGNTGLCGGATPTGGEVVVSLRRMNRIRAVDADNNSITVEAGCTLHAVQEAAREADRLFPLSLAAEGSATIGGNLSTNAGGVQVLRYGNARELTLGLEVVLADGRIWNGLRALRKDNTGYDLKHLFIGAEGTLGLITAATLKLFPRPRTHATAWVAVPDPASAVRLLGRLRDAAGDNVTAFEIVGRPALELVLRHIPNARDPLLGKPAWQVLIELGGSSDMGGDLSATLERALEAAAEDGIVNDAVLATSEAQTAALWALRENVSEAQKIEGISIKHDIAVPVSCIAEFIARADAALRAAFPEVRIVCFGHIGDGNLHYNQSRSDAQSNDEFIAQTGAVNRIVHDLVHGLGGSISAEHGLGQLKREEVLRYKSQTEMDLMRAVKQALDPRGLMNPGKLLSKVGAGALHADPASL
ncbi:FAD-binding oxidoreductase [Sulfuritalea hydrogenivorans]|uniref:Putative glycolate oxidase subunit GlcD n=1 Tax=Sulfuritalea hydrogenivorans sk43H TaxID=1223802 RepID=W0SHR6_9PROT|nr:FAD-binding oxidoreductase [Sulfuritalea hydrogenivorans]BAO30420.1 putative glycolate oxidase subunit GlcD [Sulfuritalea hydrogenivorans sk43H]